MTETRVSIDIDVPFETLLETGGMDGMNELADEFLGVILTDMSYQLVSLPDPFTIRINVKGILES